VVLAKLKVMKDLLYNLDSVEVAYGDDVANSINQIEKRILDIAEYIQQHDAFNDFEKTQLSDRVNKLIDLNYGVQQQLEAQVEKLKIISDSVAANKMPMNTQQH
jgi:hypothetical protein